MKKIKQFFINNVRQVFIFSYIIVPVVAVVYSLLSVGSAYKEGYQVGYKRGYSDGHLDHSRLDSIYRENDAVSSDSITRKNDDSIHLVILKELDKMLREGLKRKNMHKNKNLNMINKDCKLKNGVAFYLRNEGWADTINEDGEFEYNEYRDDKNFVCNRVEKDGDKYIVYATYISCYDQYLDEFLEQDGSIEVVLTQQMYDALCERSMICIDSEDKEFPTYLTVLSGTPQEIYEWYEKEYGQQ